ncbi:MAG: hypothetical protein KF763_16745 [Cyclobacteriaceae bacterium]|nr:hypothetical protein [Cyclobacteriaceae bacterium]
MKKLPQSSRPMKFVLLSLTLLFVFTHCEENVQKLKKEKEIEITAISEGLKAFIGDGNASMKNVSDYFANQYNFNFDAEFQKLKPKFVSGKQDNHPSARTQEIDLYNFQEILNSNGIAYGSYSYDYLNRLSVIFENGIYEQWEVQNIISQMRNEISNNYSMSASERSNLLNTWDALTSNYNGLVDVSYSIANGEIMAIARTKGWFRTAWRIVRSVVLTAAVGAIIGATISGPGAIVGAIVMGVVAITDAWANDYCHFAFQCDGGWRQECSTGNCAPYVI